MTVSIETFTGTDGAAPASPRVVAVLGTNTGGYFRIQSNTLEANQPNMAYHGQVCNWDENDYAYVDTKVKIKFVSTDAERYPAIGFRMSGGTMGWAEPWGEVNNGYCAYLDNLANMVCLQRQSGGTQQQVWQVSGKIINGDDEWWLRVLADGSAIKVKTWKATGLEPSTWDIEVTDSTWTTGRLGLRAQAQAMDVKTRFDDWYFDDGVTTGTTYSDDLSFTVVGTSELSDARILPHTLLETVAATSQLADAAVRLDSLQADVTGTTTLADTRTGAHDLEESASATASLDQDLDMNYALQADVSGTTELVDLATRVDDLLAAVQGTTEVISGALHGSVQDTTVDATGVIEDALVALEQVVSDVVSSTELDNALQGANVYDEDVSFDTVSETTVVDLLAAVDLLLAEVAAATEALDSRVGAEVADHDATSSTALDVSRVMPESLQVDVASTSALVALMEATDDLMVEVLSELQNATEATLADALLAEAVVVTMLESFMGVPVRGLFSANAGCRVASVEHRPGGTRAVEGGT